MNLHHHGEPTDVYAALQRDYKRDQKIIRVLDLGLVLLLLGSQYSERAFQLCLFFALIVLSSRITMFVDNSNRNWAMHVIDWIERARK